MSVSREKSPFQQMVEADIAGVFLNPDEFAESHRVEGEKILCVLTADQRIPVGSGYELGVSESPLVLRADSGDLPPRKPAGEALNVDGREYVIDAWNEHMGMAEIHLTQTIVG